ncbi:MAG: UPF0175 family protein [Caldilineaceae bacterium]
MYQVTFSVPDDTLLALNTTAEQIGAELRLAAAIKLYEIGRLSSGAAANLAGIPRVLFLTKLAAYNVVTFRLSETELQEELNVGKNYF